MIRQAIFLAVTVLLFSCHPRQKFDQADWSEVADLMTFPKRNSMIDDLTTNIPLKGKKYSELIALLGEPQGKNDSGLQISYDVDVDYGSDIDPVYTKSLHFHFGKDSIVKAFEVEEWRK